jgi:SET domain-containing protein
MKTTHSELVYVKRIKGKGRGVFARNPIPEGGLIERVPVVVVPLDHVRGVDNNPVLSQICFLRGENLAGIAMGYGSLYNHAYEPNAHYVEESNSFMSFRALRPIDRDEEITINYNGDPDDSSPMSFEVL